MDKNILDPFRPGSEDMPEDEEAAREWEQPTFSVPELDRVLGNIEKETDNLMAIYQLYDTLS